MTHIALEGGCFVLSANQFCRRRDYPPAPDYVFGGADDEISPDSVVCSGGSVIISPSGTILAGPNHEGEGLISADLGTKNLIFFLLHPILLTLGSRFPTLVICSVIQLAEILVSDLKLFIQKETFFFWLNRGKISQINISDCLSLSVDLGEIVRAKFDFDVVGHYSRPEVLSLVVKDHPLNPVSFASSMESLKLS